MKIIFEISYESDMISHMRSLTHIIFTWEGSKDHFVPCTNNNNLMCEVIPIIE